jgi:hypothetical protein
VNGPVPASANRLLVAHFSLPCAYVWRTGVRDEGGRRDRFSAPFFELPVLQNTILPINNRIYMVRNTFYYLLILAIVFSGFFSLLEANTGKTEQLANKVSYDVLKYQWVIAEAIDISTLQDRSDDYQAVAYQFLSNGGFVEFEDKRIRNTGSWQVDQNRLQIKYDNAATRMDQDYYVELVRPEEMVLQNDQLRFRLFRLKL